MGVWRACIPSSQPMGGARGRILCCVLLHQGSGPAQGDRSCPQMPQQRPWCHPSRNPFCPPRPAQACPFFGWRLSPAASRRRLCAQLSRDSWFSPSHHLTYSSPPVGSWHLPHFADEDPRLREEHPALCTTRDGAEICSCVGLTLRPECPPLGLPACRAGQGFPLMLRLELAGVGGYLGERQKGPQLCPLLLLPPAHPYCPSSGPGRPRGMSGG